MAKINWEKESDRKKFWHSASHLMTQAVLRVFKDQNIGLGVGTAIDDGFYQDYDIKDLRLEDLKKIKKEMLKIVNEKLKITKRDIPKKDALKFYKKDPYKTELVNAIKGAKASMFRQGEFDNLCKGPHVSNTSEIKAIKLTKLAGAYWRGDSKNKMLTRIYGIAFPEKKMLIDWMGKKAQAEKRNHLKLGKELDLFSMHEESPGSPFFHGRGMIIWNELASLWRKEHLKRGYEEVGTPIILKKELWEQSGHWDHYQENMYFTNVDEEDYAIKPMNCPGGILVFKNKRHSYRDLPIRSGEMGTVHRHELSGVLNGLFRVRKFTQDDAHIFCTKEQISDEVAGVIELIDFFYTKIFGFTYHVELSTRPEKAMGEKKMWNTAERALKTSMKKMKLDFKINEGDGAFYGPKIDFHIKDSLGRTWQCATIQLDFAMPEKFGLEYIGKDDKPHRPVMIHRVIYGSMERFMGILIEHYGGAFPLWLNPVQAALLPITDRHAKYAKDAMEKMQEAGIRVELDARNESISYKVRDWQKQKANYILVIGDREKDTGTVTVRSREGKILGEKKVEKFIEEALKEIKERK
ncbi:MAG: threonine--tRNA ligase [archaeon]|jgi:threonyl-tRNA synthetase|nr:threonine--tRNA ligase [archaeon]